MSKNLNFFVLSLHWFLGSSDILILVTTNFLSMTTGTKNGTVPAFLLAYIYKFIAYVVNFRLIFKTTVFVNFSVYKNGKTKIVLIKFRPAIGASPL